MQMCFRYIAFCLVTLTCIDGPIVEARGPRTAESVSNFAEYYSVFDLPEKHGPYKVLLIEQSAPANVFIEGEQPRLVFQLQNQTNTPIRTEGTVTLVRYGMRHVTGEWWIPKIVDLGDAWSKTVKINLSAKGFQNLTIEPELPETKGGYALLFDLGTHGRAFGTTMVRVFKSDGIRVQYGHQAMETLPPAVIQRLGFNAVGRMGVQYRSPNQTTRQAYLEKIYQELNEYDKHGITVVLEFGAGEWKGAHHPLSRTRPHLDADGVMKKGKADHVWMPDFDKDYKQYVYDLVAKHGWPKGPVTGVMLWNEPWEGKSISGWQADMIRYRTLFRLTAEAVFEAREKAGVDVLVGGADSSSNTWDKYFGEGLENSPFWPEMLDFVSVHYQGMNPPVLYPEWNQREHYKGKVKVWDTESWVANSDDLYAAVVAANRAAGYDRAMGTLARYAISKLSHRRIAKDKVMTDSGTETRARLLNARPLAASYSAVQKLIGERPFNRTLFRESVPFVFLFDAISERQTASAVVVGNLDIFQNGDNTLFLGDVDPLDPDQPPTLTLPASSTYRVMDFYGNPIKPTNGVYTIPLTPGGIFVTATPKTGDAPHAGVEDLAKALSEARIDGIEPINITAHDMTKPIEQGPAIAVDLTNQLERPITAAISIDIPGLQLDHPVQITLEGRESTTIQAKVIGGSARPDNLYAMTLRLDAGDNGSVVHEETMRVNQIARRSIKVDGKLDDWSGTLPQSIDVRDNGAEASFEEQMWLPFENFDTNITAEGFSSGFIAYDDDHFYFAAKIVDTTPTDGTVRFAERDEDAYFYPEISVEIDEESGKRVEHRWPEGVRRFSYRRQPHLPSSCSNARADNVLIAFNVLEPGEDGREVIPETMAKRMIGYTTTDYQYALNRVAEKHGGGTEVWRLEVPGMPRKHFYPRQPKHPLEGAVDDAELIIRHEGNTRIVEISIPWSEIPTVHKKMLAREPIKFSYRVNHDRRSPDMELPRGRSTARGISKAFHPDWSRSWPNELVFGWEAN